MTQLDEVTAIIKCLLNLLLLDNNPSLKLNIYS